MALVEHLQTLGTATFSSLRLRNYRLYYIGQIISTSGTWMQSVAQAWLVLKLTNSGTALGLVTALQYLPTLLLGPVGGVIADRFSKRKLLYFTQSALGLLALILGTLVATGLVQVWMIAVIALCFGFVNVVDNPTRQSFVIEMVGEDELKNAVTLYSILINVSRVIGPAIAGLLIVAVGLAPCFILNGLSYAAVVIMLYAMRSEELRPASPVGRARGQIAAGFQYVFSTPAVRDVLIIMAITGTLTYEFQVSLPLIAQNTYHGGADSYALLTAALGLGAVAGGLITAGRKNTSFQAIVMAAMAFGVSVLVVSLMPALWLAVLALVVVGFFSITFTAMGSTTLQLESAPQMRGRVMAFWSIALLGSTTIGGPIIGFIGQHAGPQWALATGGLAALVAAAYGVSALNRQPVAAKLSGRENLDTK